MSQTCKGCGALHSIDPVLTVHGEHCYEVEIGRLKRALSMAFSQTRHNQNCDMGIGGWCWKCEFQQEHKGDIE